MPGAYTVTTRTTGQVLTASIYNSDHQSHIDHLEPQYIDDASTNLAAMQATTDPGELSAENLPTTLAGEMARLRYALYDVKKAVSPRTTQWYETPYGYPVFNVQAYGADPTGVADSTSAFTACIAAAAATGYGVVYGRGAFSISHITILNGVRQFIIDGVLNDRGANSNISTSLSASFPVGVVNLGGPNFGGGSVVSDLTIQANISIANGCRAGLIMDGSLNCVVQHCRIVGPSDTSIGQHGILIYQGSGNIVVRDCTITFGGNAPTQYQECITGWGCVPTKDDYYNNGTGMAGMAAISSPLSNIRIYGNDLIGGSHGIIFFGSQHVQVYGNRVHNHRDRNTEFFVSNTDVVVASNVLTDFKSAAVTSGCGMQDLKVIGNICTTTIGNGEGAIQCYLGGRNIHVHDNYIDASGDNTFGHGVYLGVDIQGAHISGNVIKYPRVAGIAVDSEWKAGNVVGSPALFYGRINSIAPPTGSVDAFNDTKDITITNNDIYNGLNAYGSVVAISLNQVKTATTLTNVHVIGNRVMGNNMLYNMVCYEEQSGNLSGVRYLHNSSAQVNPALFAGSRSMSHFEVFDFNDVNSEYQLTATTTTPSVLGNIKRITCSTAGLITNFTNGIAAQVITVRLDANSGIQNNGSIYVRGGADISVGAATSSYFVTLVYTGGKWFETARNF